MDIIKSLFDVTGDLDLLYVEDDLLLRKKTMNILTGMFRHVDCAANGQEALNLYGDYYDKNLRYYDLVVSDIKMPFLDGLQLCKIILDINENQSIIITSAYNDPDELIEFINLGIKKFVKKPFQTKNMIDVFYDVCSNLAGDKKDKIVLLGDDYYWDKDRNALYKKGDDHTVKLSYTETALLKLLIENPNRIFSNADIYEELSNSLIGLENDFSLDLIKSIVKRIRKKTSNNIIENIYAQGYRLNLR